MLYYIYNWNNRKRRENGTDEVFQEIMVKKFPKLKKDINPQIQESPRTPIQRKPPLDTCQSKLLVTKDTENILKSSQRRKNILHTSEKQ